LLLDRNGMQMEEEVRQHYNDSITSIRWCWMPKDTLPDL